MLRHGRRSVGIASIGSEIRLKSLESKSLGSGGEQIEQIRVIRVLPNHLGPNRGMR